VVRDAIGSGAFIGEVAGEPNREDAVLANALSVVEVEFLGPDAARTSFS